MGRIILLLLFVLAAYLVWKAFGPSTWKKREVDQPRAIKGPDDDEEPHPLRESKKIRDLDVALLLRLAIPGPGCAATQRSGH